MEGTLEKMPLPDVVQDFSASRRSGVVHLAQGEAKRSIYFLDGEIVFASSNTEAERLGERLVQEGKLNRAELELACKVRESSQLRMGRTLVDLGYLSDVELTKRVREQVAAIVVSVLPWESGSYRTEVSDSPVDEDLITEGLSVENLILEGVRHIEDAAAIRRRLGDLDRPLRFTHNPLRMTENLHLTPQEGFVMSRVDGDATVGEIAKVSPLGEDETLRCVYGLVAAGLLEKEPASRPVASDPPRVASVETNSPASATKPIVPKAPVSPPEAPPNFPPAHVSERAEQLTSRMATKLVKSDGQTHYELLEVEQNAAANEVKAAYYALVRQLHPDHRSGLKIADPYGVFDALYLKVKAAYEVLSSETERRRYDFSLQQKREKMAAARRRAEELNPKRSTARAPTAEPAPRGSHVAVSKPKEKETQEQPQQESEGGRTFSAKEMARLHFTNGKRYYDDGRFHEAVEELGNAVRLDSSRSEYHRLLGRALSKNRHWRKRAEEHFLRALALNRFDAESYIELGELYEIGGLDMRAKKMYQEAAAIDPDNRRALGKLGSSVPGDSAFDKLKGMFKGSPKKPTGH